MSNRIIRLPKMIYKCRLNRKRYLLSFPKILKKKIFLVKTKGECIFIKIIIFKNI